MYPIRSARRPRKGGDEMHESQLREPGGKFLSLWEKLLNWVLLACLLVAKLAGEYFSLGWVSRMYFS